MKVLITGATGLIGSKISELCLDKGWSVNYLSTSKEKLQQKEDYKGFYWNPKVNEIDKACLDGVDVIIHLVGASIAKRWTNSYKKEILSSRVETTKMLYDLLKTNKNSVKSIISASAIGIYPSSSTNYYDESYKDVNNSFLGDIVQKWENAVDTFKDLNIDVTKLRIGIVLSSKSGALPKIVQPIKMGIGAAFGDGKQWQSWIHIDDLANMFLYALEKNISGVINAVAPNPVSNRELSKAVATHLNKPLILPDIPKMIIDFEIQMRQSADELDFEKAIQLRDRINKLKQEIL